MKKIIFLAGFVMSLVINAQQHRLVINNYTAYDFLGNVYAKGTSGPSPCYPSLTPVANSSGGNFWITIPAATALPSPTVLDIGYYSSGTVIPWFQVSTSATSSNYRAAGNPTLAIGNTISNNSDWDETKFHLTYPGTTTYIPNGGVNLSSGTTPCSAYPTSFSNGTVSADWYTIGSYSYIDVY